MKHLGLQSQISFSDINMPTMDGLTFIEQVKAFDSELPVIFLTGYADVSVAVRAMQSNKFSFRGFSNRS